MTRVALSDGSGWFDISKATKFSEGTRWSGSDQISLNTGTLFSSVDLDRTSSGKWIKHFSSRSQCESYTFILCTDVEAAKWFCINEYEDNQIPPDILPVVKSHLDTMEL